MRYLPLLLALLTSPALAHQSDGSPASRASEALAGGSALVVAGSMATLAGGASLVVGSVAVLGEGTLLVLESVAQGASVTLRLSGKAAEGLSVVAGTTVEVSVLASGTLLVASGKVLCFIPNELGKALLHQSRVRA